MIKIGITGQNGFIGSYLFNRLSLIKEEFTLIPFNKNYFEDSKKLIEWIEKCDVIVHLAAQNRHNEPEVIFNTNISLVEKLIEALKNSSNNPHILFSSSTQENKENPYGKSKLEGRLLLKEWAYKNNTCLTGLIIPNVFGPFGKPMYNSVVATFSYQLCNNQKPTIEVDGKLKLIYVGELVTEIIKAIQNKINNAELIINYTSEFSVSDILNKLCNYKLKYLENGIIPRLENDFEKNLFNTFRSYINHSTHFPVLLKKNEDKRGVFVETIKLEIGGQVSFSTTVPNITRGNHFHTRKIERFTVIKGKAIIQIRKYNTNEIIEFYLDGKNPSYVDMPIWYVHNIKNIGEEDLYTIFWINEFYDENDADTYFENVLLN
jgi:UDP-2-acetamido-2,6-beta-L-arabino-hexul-4-ose reductase